jgi:CHAD domain-containing protein
VTTRSFIKHIKEPGTYAVETDEDGFILAALDVSSEMTSGGICPHLLPTLPLAGRVEDIEVLMRARDEYEPFEPDCGNVHHLMNDLLSFEREYRQSETAFALADSKAKALKKEMEAKAVRVHDLLSRISDRKPLPLFENV